MVFNFENIKALAQEKANREGNSIKIYYISDINEYYGGTYYIADNLKQLESFLGPTSKIYYSTSVYPESE